MGKGVIRSFYLLRRRCWCLSFFYLVFNLLSENNVTSFPIIYLFNSFFLVDFAITFIEMMHLYAETIRFAVAKKNAMNHMKCIHWCKHNCKMVEGGRANELRIADEFAQCTLSILY